MPEIEPRPQPAQLRISDAERHQVAEILRQAAGDGRLDFDELDERLEATYAAKTYADLVPLTQDLPVAGPGQPAAPAAPGPAVSAGRAPVVVDGPESENHVAILGGFERKGVWTVPAHLTVFCFMGGAEIDLREARFAAREVVITVNAVMGGAEIKVNEHTHVVMDGVGIMGGYGGPRGGEQVPADAPTVRVRGVAIMGGVGVERYSDDGTGRDRGHELGHRHRELRQDMRDQARVLRRRRRGLRDR